MGRMMSRDKKSTKKGGRKMRVDSRYTKALGARICAQVANGATIVDIAGDLGLAPNTLYSWVKRYADFRAGYEEAQALRLSYAEDRLLQLCRQAHEVARSSGEARLQLEAMKMELAVQQWRLGKLVPGRYGDKSQLEITGKDGASLLPQHTREEDMEYLAMLAEVQAKLRREE